MYSASGGHGGPPLHLHLEYIDTLGVNVGVALRGHPIVDFKTSKLSKILGKLCRRDYAATAFQSDTSSASNSQSETGDSQHE